MTGIALFLTCSRKDFAFTDLRLRECGRRLTGGDRRARKCRETAAAPLHHEWGLPHFCSESALTACKDMNRVGKMEGKEGILQMARNMKQQGLPVDMIQKVMGLPSDVCELLQSEWKSL